jgi:hypothetical protein
MLTMPLCQFPQMVEQAFTIEFLALHLRPPVDGAVSARPIPMFPFPSTSQDQILHAAPSSGQYLLPKLLFHLGRQLRSKPSSPHQHKLATSLNISGTL